MKKFILFIGLLLFPTIVYASDFDITNYYINADILNNGDVNVTELIVLEGSFNGYIRDILYYNPNLYESSTIDYSNSYIYNANELSNLEISGKNISDVTFKTLEETDFNIFEEVSYGSEGDIYKYVTSVIDGGYSYKMYHPAYNEKVAFLISYTIEDAVVIHNDVAEFYWNFIGDEYDTELNDVIIRVNLPSVDDSDNFRIWAHGGSNYVSGEINFIDNNSFEAIMPLNDAYSPIDIRTTFDKSLITDVATLDHSNEEALEKIIAVETTKADEANSERFWIKIKYYGVIYSSYALIGATIIAFIYVYIKYDKEIKSNFYSKYYREFIEDYDVEVVEYVMKKSIGTDAFSASIMNMIYKKNIKVETMPNKKREFTFTLLNTDKLSKQEIEITDLLFKSVGRDNKFTSQELESFSKDKTTCYIFMNNFNSWKSNVEIEAGKHHFFEKIDKPTNIAGILLIISVILCVFTYLLSVETYMSLLALGVVLIFVVYTNIFSKKTIKGMDHFKKWNAFKNFLEDFGNFEERELPEIILWDRYLVYATVFGIADKVEKAMKVKLSNLSDVNNATYSTNTLTNLYLASAINRTMNNSYTKANNKVNAMNAKSSSSSGGGFGGGFSGGGGFGGGGGGGRGF